MQNLFNLNDQTRIKLLKSVLITQAAGSLIQLYFHKKTSDELLSLVTKHNLYVRRMHVAGDIIRYFADHADPILVEEVGNKFEFDWIVAELEDPEK
jgi:hypothetical protein